MDDLPPADVHHSVTPNLEIAQILTEGEAFDDVADFGVYFLGCAAGYSRFGGYVQEY